ncbi:MAG TPA: hypothetical protein VJ813_18740 [Vicinamibacterales bacterium]|nr:hypothetical protein [Vicinamibacterales bacterium]
MRERRGPDRPSNGDIAVCPKCRKNTVEFNERYRLTVGEGVAKSTPAWVCDGPSCGYRQPARSEDEQLQDTPKPRMASMKLPPE